MRDSAEHYGADLSDHGKLPTARDAADQYTASVERWLWEAPASATAALALVEFAGVITADRFLGEVLRASDNGGGARRLLPDDRLATAAGWINRLALNELVERSRDGKGGAA
jgi:hypothetical protein